MLEHRLGDDIDDYCIKCKRLTNHSIVSLLNGEPAKVRCRTCYNDHDFRRCEVPPTKKELKKLQMMNEALAAGGAPPEAPGDDIEPVIGAEDEVETEASDETPQETPKPKAAAKRKG